MTQGLGRVNQMHIFYEVGNFEQMNKTLDDIAKQQAGGAASSASNQGPPKPPLRGIPGFFVAFFKEVRKDVTGS